MKLQQTLKPTDPNKTEETREHAESTRAKQTNTKERTPRGMTTTPCPHLQHKQQTHEHSTREEGEKTPKKTRKEEEKGQRKTPEKPIGGGKETQSGLKKRIRRGTRREELGSEGSAQCRNRGEEEHN